VGAIDGTHVLARVPAKSRAAFLGRKHTTTQNVMAAVDFDLRFTYVLAGPNVLMHPTKKQGQMLAIVWFGWPCLQLGQAWASPINQSPPYISSKRMVKQLICKIHQNSADGPFNISAFQK